MERLPNDMQAERVSQPDTLDLDPVRLYLDQAGKTPLLTREQEREIGISIVEGRAAKEELMAAEAAGQVLEAEEQASLQARVQAGEAGREHMLTANLRLVVSIAKRHYRPSGLDLLDLIQEGNLGLSHAVDMFDPYKGFKFSTYATWWIRQAITRETHRQGNSLRLPSNVSQRVASLTWHEDNYLRCTGQLPTDEVLCQTIGISRQKLGETREFRNLQNSVMELDRPLGLEGSSATTGELIADKQSAADFKQADDRLQAANLIDKLDKLSAEGVLTATELAMIKLHYKEDLPAEKIAETLGLKEQGASKNLNQAIRKARFGLAGVAIPEGKLTTSRRQELDQQVADILEGMRQEYTA